MSKWWDSNPHDKRPFCQLNYIPIIEGLNLALLATHSLSLVSGSTTIGFAVPQIADIASRMTKKIRFNLSTVGFSSEDITTIVKSSCV